VDTFKKNKKKDIKKTWGREIIKSEARSRQLRSRQFEEKKIQSGSILTLLFSFLSSTL
jgi:hypothetical protein